MDEKYFWGSLEFRLCHEFAGLPERRYQYFWCDGFIPTNYLLDDPRPRITGKVWICNGPAQKEWDFALLLPRPFEAHEEIDWASLLPPKDVTRWMTFDEGCRYIEIEPAVAVPDDRIVLTENAMEDFKALDARRRAKVRDTLSIHLIQEPTKESKSRIKRLSNLSHPQYRLRVNDLKVFYDITENDVVVLAIMTKEKMEEWLKEHGGT
jgi:mRNA-degrading endonuclease RelE of RelBE toxin-antitoxin system